MNAHHMVNTNLPFGPGEGGPTCPVVAGGDEGLPGPHRGAPAGRALAVVGAQCAPLHHVVGAVCFRCGLDVHEGHRCRQGRFIFLDGVQLHTLDFTITGRQNRNLLIN